MKKENSWISPYKQKRFLDSHTQKAELPGDDLFNDKRKTAVVIMLDVQGTIDGIDDEKAQTFMSQLHKLRIKYNANYVVINMSSHIYTSNGLVKYLEILHRNLKPRIILDDASYLYGTYNYETGIEETISRDYNLRKIEVFEDKFFSKYKVLCHGIIDDSVSTDYVKRFKDIRPVFIIRSSQNSDHELRRDNMMCYSTLTEGFEGVLECMSSYLDAIKDIPAYKIVNEQSKELTHLSAWEVKKLCIDKNLDLVLRYVSEGKLDDDDYERVARELGYLINSNELSTDELIKVRKIIEALSKYLDKNNEYLLSLVNSSNEGK